MDIKTFAKTIKVSPTTVSSALTGRGRISPETRDMVLAKMSELGYTPNLNGRRLVSGKSYVVALAHIEACALSDLYTIEFARAMVMPLKQRGYDLWLSLAEDGEAEFTALAQKAESKTVDGCIILGGGLLSHATLRKLASPEHPCVLVGHEIVEGIPYVGTVMTLLENGAREVANLFRKHGHQRIAFIDDDLQDNVARYFAQTLNELGCPFGADNIITVGRRVEDGAQAMNELLKQPNPPTAVFTRTDELAIGAVREVRRLGMRVPRDISIVGHDNLSLLSIAEPALTTVEVSSTKLAEAAARAFFDLMEHKVIKPIMVESSLVTRQTVGPAPSVGSN